MLELSAMTHRELTIDGVAVTSSDALARDVPSVGKVGHDSLRRAFSHADRRRDVAESHIQVLLKA